MREAGNDRHHRARGVDSTQVKPSDRVLRVHAMVLSVFCGVGCRVFVIVERFVPKIKSMLDVFARATASMPAMHQSGRISSK
jgi:hypothetical protein